MSICPKCFQVYLYDCPCIGSIRNTTGTVATSVSEDDVKKAIKLIKNIPKHNVFTPHPTVYKVAERMGLKFIYNYPRPKLQLSNKVTVSDKFRVEYNAWLIECFGYYEEVPKQGNTYLMPTYGMIVCNWRDQCFINSVLCS